MYVIKRITPVACAEAQLVPKYTVVILFLKYKVTLKGFFYEQTAAADQNKINARKVLD